MKYTELETLMHCFPKVCITALSATIILNVLSYIKKLLYFLVPTCFYKQPLNYSNIIQMVAPIIKPRFNKLDFLIFKTSLIPKIMVFVNKINNIMKITAYFCLLLLPKNWKQENILIRMFYSNFEASTCLDFIEDFQTNKDTRILIFTNAARMSVNIPNIIRVI